MNSSWSWISAVVKQLLLRVKNVAIAQALAVLPTWTPLETLVFLLHTSWCCLWGGWAYYNTWTRPLQLQRNLFAQVQQTLCGGVKYRQREMERANGLRTVYTISEDINFSWSGYSFQHIHHSCTATRLSPADPHPDSHTTIKTWASCKPGGPAHCTVQQCSEGGSLNFWSVWVFNLYNNPTCSLLAVFFFELTSCLELCRRCWQECGQLNVPGRKCESLGVGF